MNWLKRLFKWNRFVAIQQFMSEDPITKERTPHIYILTRNAVYEVMPDQTQRPIVTLKEAEKAVNHKGKVTL